MIISNDYEYFLTRFKIMISFDGELNLYDLRLLAEQKGLGAEYYFCTYDKEDEDYMEDKVCLILWKPVVDEDMMTYIEKPQFYSFLYDLCQEFIELHPNKENDVLGLLNKIKEDLAI